MDRGTYRDYPGYTISHRYTSPIPPGSRSPCTDETSVHPSTPEPSVPHPPCDFLNSVSPPDSFSTPIRPTIPARAQATPTLSNDRQARSNPRQLTFQDDPVDCWVDPTDLENIERLTSLKVSFDTKTPSKNPGNGPRHPSTSAHANMARSHAAPFRDSKSPKFKREPSESDASVHDSDQDYNPSTTDDESLTKRSHNPRMRLPHTRYSPSNPKKRFSDSSSSDSTSSSRSDATSSSTSKKKRENRKKRHSRSSRSSNKIFKELNNTCSSSHPFTNFVFTPVKYVVDLHF